jgi:hypothetical protein
VDAHTAHHLYHSCLLGKLMQGRTVILVSHHVQLCAPGAAYVVTLDNGRVLFQGSRDKFQGSSVMTSLVQSTTAKEEEQTEVVIEANPATQQTGEESKGSQSTVVATPAASKQEKKTDGPRKLIEEEARAVGRVARDVWVTYFKACGGAAYWSLFVSIFIVAALGPVLENGWISYWSRGDEAHTAIYYIVVYAIVGLNRLLPPPSSDLMLLAHHRWSVCYHTAIYRLAQNLPVGLILTTLRWLVLCTLLSHDLCPMLMLFLR